MMGLEFNCEKNHPAYVTALVDKNGVFQLHGRCPTCLLNLKWDLDPLLAAVRNATFLPGNPTIN